MVIPSLQPNLQYYSYFTYMPRGVDKANLPAKTCETCGRPFTWRKVWEKCWDEVLTCSDRCKSERKKARQAAARAARSPSVAGDSKGDGDAAGTGSHCP